MSKNQSSRSKGFPILNGQIHFLKPSLITCSFFPVRFPFRSTFIFPQIVCLLLLECLETSVVTACPREKAINSVAWYLRLPLSAPSQRLTCSPPAPLLSAHVSNTHGLVCACSWKNGKPETEGSRPGWRGHSQSSGTQWAVRGSMASRPHTPQSLSHTVPLSCVSFIVRGSNIYSFSKHIPTTCERQALC